MTFSPELAEIRFGYGLSPRIAPPATPLDMLQSVAAPDTMAQTYPIDGYAGFLPRVLKMRELRDIANRDRSKKDALKAFRKARNETRNLGLKWTVATLMRATQSPGAFRERLVAFWADHFTAMGKNGILLAAGATYIEDAIRPHVAGSFSDMLRAVVTHPVMLHYLDQNRSVGPGSAAARVKRRLDGLNENLAREVMELHTLGVGGPYTQDDVRQLAELFTGLSYDFKKGFRFKPRFAEPGYETVLGRQYGGDPARLAPVLQALDDLAAHPATAGHIARKLAVHFVSDTPDPDLVAQIEARFGETGGNLMALYSALLEHPAAWSGTLSNVKPPVDFIASTWRALAVRPDHALEIKPGDIRRLVERPLQLMGQPWQRPNGPDGWPEQDAAWITPQGVSARLRWAMSAPGLLQPDLPDPRRFVDQALGGFATRTVRFAAASAESRAEAIGLVLASPAFQRR